MKLVDVFGAVVFWDMTTYRPSVILEAFYSTPHIFSTEQGRNYRIHRNVSTNLPDYKDLAFNNSAYYEGWNFNSSNYLFTTDTK